MEYKDIIMQGDIENVRFVLQKKGKRMLYVIGINPSTANKDIPDPTMRKVMGFADCNGFDGFTMLNIYPQRTNNPKELHLLCDQDLHKQNIEIIESVFYKCQHPTVLMAYGNAINQRVFLKNCLRDIVSVLMPHQPQWKQIGSLTKKGNPRHPLYAPYSELRSYTIDVFPRQALKAMRDASCNSISFMGILGNKEIYTIGNVGKDGIPEPTGLPTLILWNGRDIEIVSGIKSFEIMGQLE